MSTYKHIQAEFQRVGARAIIRRLDRQSLMRLQRPMAIDIVGDGAAASVIVDLAQMAGLGIGSTATLHCGDEKFHRLVGPVIWKAGQWALPILYCYYDPSTSLVKYHKESAKYRRETGLEPQTV